VGFGEVGYKTTMFDNLVVTAGPARTGQITSGFAGKCLAAKGNGSANGTPVVIDPCGAAGSGQTWTVSGTMLQINGKCLDVNGRGTANGVLVQLWTCNGGTNQQWNVGANSSLVGTGSGKCLDSDGSADGTQQEIWTCNGGTNQIWRLPS
jgi:hypothetical protein